MLILQRSREKGVAEETANAVSLARANSINESALDASLTLGPTNTAEGEMLVKTARLI